MSLEFLSLEIIQEIARRYGYWVIFLGIGLENTGIPLPGETVTLVGGFLAGSGDLSYWLVLLSAAFGAFVGNTFGYWIGEVGGWPILLKLGSFFGVQEASLEEVKQQFSDNAVRAVFFGRFVPLLRIFAGPMAGIAKMPYPQFLLCNFCGAAIWASIMVTLSFTLGRILPLDEVVSLVAKFGFAVLLLVIAWFTVPPLWKALNREVSQEE